MANFNYGTTYIISVSGHTSAGEGIDRTLTITTKPFTGPVRDLKLVVKTIGSRVNASLTWKPPANFSKSNIKVSRNKL